MKPIISIYCESNDIKVAVIGTNSANGKPAVLKTASISHSKSANLDQPGGGFNVEEESPVESESGVGGV